MLELPKEACPDPIHRLVPSRFPPVTLFDFARDAAELEAMAILEGYTNDRLLDEIGDIALVPDDQRRFGEGYTPIMAAFTHIGFASRFTDGRFGIYYGAFELSVALAETSYHRARFMAASNEAPTDITLREYIATPRGDILFGRITRESHPQCLEPDPADYGPAQRLGSQWRHQGEYGLLYPSVRADDGQCLAVMRPDALGPALQAGHYTLIWDGERISHRFEYREV